MKEDREGWSSSSCIEDWDLGILGGRTVEYLLHTDLVLHTINIFLCSNSLTNIIFSFSLSGTYVQIYRFFYVIKIIIFPFIF